VLCFQQGQKHRHTGLEIEPQLLGIQINSTIPKEKNTKTHNHSNNFSSKERNQLKLKKKKETEIVN